MIKAISNWWNKDKQEIERLRKEVQDTMSIFTAVQESMFKYKAELEEVRAANPNMKAEGVLEPWMIIEVRGENALKGLPVRIDWNEAMIQHMRDKGYTYKNEDSMIQNFVAQLYEHVIMTIEEKVIDDSDLHTKNEFE